MFSKQETEIKDITINSYNEFLKAPKQKKKIPLIEPVPLDLNENCCDSEDDFYYDNLSYIKSNDERLDINVFSSLSTKASDDEMNNIEVNVNNFNNNKTTNHQKKITILEILKKKIQL